jgi:hypothetical protein
MLLPLENNSLLLAVSSVEVFSTMPAMGSRYLPCNLWLHLFLALQLKLQQSLSAVQMDTFMYLTHANWVHRYVMKILVAVMCAVYAVCLNLRMLTY